MRPKLGVSRLRFELTTPRETLAETVERLVALGAATADIPPSADHDGGVVLADPDGNEFTLLAS